MATKDSAIATRPLTQELFASRIYKRNQGRMVRQFTCLAIWLVAGVGAWRMHTLFLQDLTEQGNTTVGYLIAVAVGAVGCWIGYRLVNWPRFADFLISVEAELSKVSWPTQKELIRASMVVIFTVLFLSAVLFAYDAIWQYLFSLLGIAN